MTKAGREETVRGILTNWDGPKSVCRCGHTGDHRMGAPQEGEHAGLIGHGYCKVPGCLCDKFTWADYAPKLRAKLGYK